MWEEARISGDLVGWDFIHNDNLPYDDHRHGTHVAGTIGAVGGNGRGISGVSPRVSIMAVKFLSASGSGSTANAIKAIDYAVSRGAKVLNNSWGSAGSGNRALQDAIARSERAGALFVAAAGNAGSDNDRRPTYPASYNLPNVISVASTTSADGLSSFSNRGARSVHVGAPGSAIYSTVPGNRYLSLSGTSMAAPHVSGAAALLWAQNPNWTYRQVRSRLIETGDPLPSLRGRTTSGKRINVLRALGR
jgi:large repetitive protein